MLIDFHAHILPKADHGSDSIECSLNQMRKAVEAGVGTIVATPHFYLDIHSVESFIERREQAYISICVNAKTPKIIKAAEVAIRPGIEKIENISELCIENTNYIILEMPNGIWNDWIYSAIYEIEAKRKLRPIIAHIDRYNQASIKHLLEMKVITQVNADSLCTLKNRKSICDLFLNNKAHVLGSDAHGTAEEYKAFSKAVKILGDICDTVMDNAQRIINNEGIQ